MALVRQVAVVTGTPAASLVAGGAASTLYGLAATNALSTAVYYVKIFWEGTGTAVPRNTSLQPATTIPVAGTTVPSMTLAVPTGGIFNLSFDPMNNGGRIWYWVTLNPGPADATAIATGGDQITFIYG